MTSWWLSFVANHANIGVCIVDAEDIGGAVRRAAELGINPGGQVMGWPMPDDAEDLQRFPKNVLLTQERLKEAGYLRLKDVDGETRKYIEDQAHGACGPCNDGN
jgi:hypothetical protein